MNDMDDSARPEESRHAPDQPYALPAAGPAPWNRSESWNIPDVASEDLDDSVRPLAALVSFHYLRAAVRRRWRLCVLFTLFGVFLGMAFLVANPAPRTATTTLRLTHQEQGDPSGAIATDVSLLTTRTVAERTIRALGLTISPEDLMNSVKAAPSDSPEILQLTMSAPTDAGAVRRLDRFTKEYLSFRAKQISAQSDILIKGYEDQIDALQSEAQKLDERINTLAATGDTATDRLTTALTQQSQVNEKINSLRDAVQEETLRQNSIVFASRVIDPAAPMPPSGLRRAVLVLASGLIGGLALGLGVVVSRAILSDRLWLRIEVASALNASVLLSVRRITPLSGLLRIVRFLPWVKGLDTRRAVERQRMAHAIEKAMPNPGRRPSLAVVCLDNSPDMRFGVVAAAADVQRHGRTATIVDLTEAGGAASAIARTAGAAGEWTPQVFRPSVIPSLTKGPSHIDSADWEDVALVKGRSGVTLILADLDPGVGVDHLTAWTDCVIVAVTAGKSSVELVRTAGDLVRSVGLQLRGAVLLRAVRDDMSSGIATPVAERDTDTSDPAVSRPETAWQPPEP
jgi:capsular polysaccharide biosynthesis protein